MGHHCGGRRVWSVRFTFGVLIYHRSYASVKFWVYKIMKKYLLYIFILWMCCPLLVKAQDSSYTDTEEKEPLVTINGYLKELGTLSFSKQMDNYRYDNLIHNRLNSQWNLGKRWIGKLEVRNRIFNGYTVESLHMANEQFSALPTYGQVLDEDLGLVDLSWTWMDGRQIVGHTTIDRLSLAYRREKWELKVGRQRINWGKTMAWNPNDLFNTYSYLDFDYEERPGADAIRFQYFRGYASGFEVAIRPDETIDKSVAAVMLKHNNFGYDFQWLVGSYFTELAVGMGWAGNIKGIGFKGEATYFHPRENWQEQSGFINATLGFDYIFPNSLYAQVEFLYNGNWDDTQSAAELLARPLPANNLFIARTAFLVGTSYQIHPLVSLTASAIVSPTDEVYIFVPGFTVSLAENLDFLITSQVLRSKQLEQALTTPNLVFGRFKWSF